jgi:hypothetical protein
MTEISEQMEIRTRSSLRVLMWWSLFYGLIIGLLIGDLLANQIERANEQIIIDRASENISERDSLIQAARKCDGSFIFWDDGKPFCVSAEKDRK